MHATNQSFNIDKRLGYEAYKAVAALTVFSCITTARSLTMPLEGVPWPWLAKGLRINK
jgi:hypothetical protein